MNREDWLVEQLNKDNLNANLRTKYEAELEAIAERFEVVSFKKKAAAKAEANRRAEIRRRLLENDEDLVLTLGQEEFGEDYEITQEGDDFVIYSKVARDNQTHRRVHASQEAADKDFRYLLFNRLYDKYVRSGEEEAIWDLAA